DVVTFFSPLSIISAHEQPARSPEPADSTRPVVLSSSSNREEHLPVLRQWPVIVSDRKLQRVADFSHFSHRVGSLRGEHLRLAGRIVVLRLDTSNDVAQVFAELLEL